VLGDVGDQPVNQRPHRHDLAQQVQVVDALGVHGGQDSAVTVAAATDCSIVTISEGL
jgi:hypothetical protein